MLCHSKGGEFMKAEVFLYGRTEKHDYIDMFSPDWLAIDTDEYKEYRKTVSFIMKIRDILSEEKSQILRETVNSFVFYRGRSISMLCRFCHVSGVDQFGRPICSTEGFIVKNESLKDFWTHVPQMILQLSSAEKTYYDEYSSLYGEEEKPPHESRTAEINSDDDSCVPQKQFEKLKEAVSRARMPFSFAFGDKEKNLYDYSKSDDQVKLNIFFAADECTDIDFGPEEEKKEADLGEYKFWVDIKKSPQGRMRYRLVLANEPGADKKISGIPYVSYERESGSEIKISELYAMHETMYTYIAENETGNTQKKCIPFNSDIDTEYTGTPARLEYRPPAEQKRSLMQILKGIKLPDFTEHIVFRCGDEEKTLVSLCEIFYMSDDSTSRLVSFDKLMEAVN